MKTISAIVITAGILLSSAAYAEPPEEVIVTDIIRLHPGEPRTYEFRESVKRIGTAAENVVTITAHTDRTFTIQAIEPGQALVVAQKENGEIIHRMLIEVGYDYHLVRMISGKGETVYQCSDQTGCQLFAPEIKRDPFKAREVEVQETKPTAGGGSITTTTRDYKAQ